VVNRRGGRDCGLGPRARLDAAGDGLGEGRGADIVEVLRLSTKIPCCKYTLILLKLGNPPWLDLVDDSSEPNLRWTYLQENESSSKADAASTLIKI
jgi:hypothetical protein